MCKHMTRVGARPFLRRPTGIDTAVSIDELVFGKWPGSGRKPGPPGAKVLEMDNSCQVNKHGSRATAT
jgi:hypothetical protein